MRVRLRAVAYALTVCGVLLIPAGSSAQTSDDLFNDQAIRRVDLLVNSRDWEKLKANFQENDYYPADLTWQGQTVRNIGIRSRGLGSRSAFKPGLRVDFNRYATGQTFLGLSSFILDNLTQDPTGLRERVAMRFYERMGLPAPRETHVQLYVNQAYAGLYAIVESIDKDFLRRVFSGTPGDIENDGHLFEYQYFSEWYFNYLGPGLDPYAPLFDPVTHENASTFELYDHIEAMVRAINETPDAAFVSTVNQYLDLALFMRLVGAQNFLAEWDGVLGYSGVNNFYFYRFENSLRSQILVWDSDNTFHTSDFAITSGHEQNVLMRRAMLVPELRALYFSALAEAAASAMEPVVGAGMGWLEWDIVRQRDLTAQAMQLDPVKPFTNEQVAVAMDEMVAFARGRAAFVMCQAAILTGTTNPLCVVP